MKAFMKMLKEKYPFLLPTSIAVTPFIAAVITPATIAGPVFFTVLFVAIVVGLTVEFLF